jgi:hypothetical protein
VERHYLADDDFSYFDPSFVLAFFLCNFAPSFGLTFFLCNVDTEINEQDNEKW